MESTLGLPYAVSDIFNNKSTSPVTLDPVSTDGQINGQRDRVQRVMRPPRGVHIIISRADQKFSRIIRFGNTMTTL